MGIGERAWSLLPELTGFQSVSATSGEGTVARHIHSILAGHPYFLANPNLLRISPINAPGNPAAVTALVRGKGNQAVILLNHHDVVDADDYGICKDMAFDPYKLTDCLNPGDLPAEARTDLESGDWLFGRGTMDMLYGLALQLALLEKFAANQDVPPGSLLFVSVPDEENNSLGMRHAIGVVREIQQQNNLDFASAVNSEPHDTVGENHLIQTGSDGKMLPLICCFGRETHAGAVYKGLNAHLLLAEVISLLELNHEFCDRDGGEVTMPPTVLRAGDLKCSYNVSIPGTAFAFFNIFTLAATPRQIMDKLTVICEQSFVNALEKLKFSSAAWAKTAASSLELPDWQPSVLTFAQLWQQCLESHGSRFIHAIDTKFLELQGQGLDLQRLTLELVSEVHKYCPDRNPKIVIALAPPFYPPVRNRRKTKKEKHVLDAVRDLRVYAEALNIKLESKEYHRGISDLSYCQLQDAGAVIHTVSSNCPTWGRAYHLPLEDIAALDAPALNLGPFGRDFHKYTERIHIPFAREKLPLLLERLVRNLLKT